MVVSPKTEYTMRDLMQWFHEAQGLGEPLIVDPCNPKDAPILQTRCVIREWDDLAALTQWLGKSIK